MEKTIALAVAEKLEVFARQGLPVLYVGSVPKEEESYRDHEPRSARIRELLKDAVAVAGAEPAIEAIRRGVPADLIFAAPAPDISFTHKKIGDTDFYFVRNRANKAQRVNAVFPLEASPQLWDAWTGGIQPVTDFQRSEKGIRMTMDFAPNGSQLLVFDPADRRAPHPEPHSAPRQLLTIHTGWTLRMPDRSRSLEKLMDWSSDPELKAFSGKATYSTHFNLEAGAFQQNRGIDLDLGSVKDVAEIRLNGKPGPVLLFSPYRADVTELLKAGDNTLEVLVTNSLTNGLLAKGVDLTGVFGAFGQKTPIPAGLMGPVKLEAK